MFGVEGFARVSTEGEFAAEPIAALPGHPFTLQRSFRIAGQRAAKSTRAEKTAAKKGGPFCNRLSQSNVVPVWDDGPQLARSVPADSQMFEIIRRRMRQAFVRSRHQPQSRPFGPDTKRLRTAIFQGRQSTGRNISLVDSGQNDS